MIPETFLQDVRIGTLLALGICGVTAIFRVVNGVMLRGFSFPTPRGARGRWIR